MSGGFMESLSKGFGGNPMFMFLILILLFGCGDGKHGGWDKMFDNNMFFLILLLFLLGDTC